MNPTPDRVSIDTATRAMRKVVAAFDALGDFADADRARIALLEYLKSRYAKAEA
jgi:hypothetical protein